MPTRIMLGWALAIGMAACAGPSPAGSGGNSAGTGAQAPAQPQRTLVIVSRAELPTLAAKPLVGFSGSLGPPVRMFNAMLDYIDENEVVHPYLQEALPQLNTDTWRVFPDGRMETTHRLRPNLTWHDGQPLTADDFVFGWRVYATRELGQANTKPLRQMEEVVAAEPRTVVIRWKQPFPDADRMDVSFQALPRHILESGFAQLDPVAFVNNSFWTTEYIGLGPYRVERWEPAVGIAVM